MHLILLPLTINLTYKLLSSIHQIYGEQSDKFSIQLIPS